MSIGIPIKVLHEAEGHVITLETCDGDTLRGKLIEAEDNMNSQMSNVAVTHRDGKVTILDNVYIRGSKIRFMILPDMLKNAPMFKGQKGGPKGGPSSRGKSGILRAQGMFFYHYYLLISTNTSLEKTSLPANQITRQTKFVCSNK